MTRAPAVRTVGGMGTDIYGSYDHLVIELSGAEALRARARRLRIPIDDIVEVRVGTAGHRPAVVIRERDGLVHVFRRANAGEVVDDLLRRGVGAPVTVGG
jgi:hypothetical protein